MCKVIGVSNQKGGVGKTSVSSNLGVGLARQGLRVCIIDADPQGSLTFGMGIDDRDKLENTLSSFIEREINDDQVDIGEYLFHSSDMVDIIPCNIKLAGYDYAMMVEPNREHPAGWFSLFAGILSPKA